MAFKCKIIPSQEFNSSFKEAGIQFTTSNQYITLSTFSIPGYAGRYSGSVTFSFWIKFTFGTNGGYVFRYYGDAYSLDYFSAYLQDDGKFSINFLGVPVETDPITPDEWKVITITYVIYADDPTYVYAYMDSTLLVYTFTISAVDVDFYSNDILTIGAPSSSFRGSLANFRIFTSGTAIVSNACNFSLRN